MITNIQDKYTYQDGNLFRLQSAGGEKAGNIAGWETICNGRKYKKIKINKKTYYLHQIIFLYHYGFIPKYIDHADGNSLNNKIENLRDVSRTENLQNLKIAKSHNKSTGVLGAYLHNCGKFMSRIKVNKKDVYLGLFDTVEQAQQAYLTAKQQFHKGYVA